MNSKIENKIGFEKKAGHTQYKNIIYLSKLTLTFLTLLSLAPTRSFAADLTPEEGLKKLSQNIETSTKNRDEYNKAIDQVSHNIITLDSATNELSTHKKKLQQQMSENKSTLALHTKKLQEIEKSRQDEEKKKQSDLLKIQQLEKALAQLKELQTIHQDRIDKLAQDRLAIETSQKEGESLQQTLAQESKTLDQRIDALKKETAPWRSKKKSYEKESARWNKEIDRHEKMQTEVKLLIDETT